MVEKKSAKSEVKLSSKESIAAIAPVLEVKSGEEYSKEKKKSAKKPDWRVFAVAAVVLVIVVALAFMFLVPKYKYSYNISGVSYLSNEYTPSEFFNGLRETKDVYVSIDIGEQTRDQMVVNSLNLWLVALNAGQKNAVSLVRVIDSNNNFAYCLTNDGNVLVTKRIESDECGAILSDASKMRIIISIGKENAAYLSNNELKVFATGSDTISTVNYHVIKQLYTNFDDLLLLVKDKIGGVSK